MDLLDGQEISARIKLISRERAGNKPIDPPATPIRKLGRLSLASGASRKVLKLEIDMGNIITVESVTSGHPDKICDQVSDAILDECLRQDPKSRVAIESFGSHGLFVIGGELTTHAKINAAKIAAKIYKDIGYKDKLKIITNIIKQSPDIAMGVDTGGAGDQGIMYGYATNETPEYMPKAVALVHKLTKGLETLRKNKKIPWLLPDGKAQVTFANGKLKTVLVSAQHEKGIPIEVIKREITNKLIKKLVPDLTGVEILVNPTGKFEIGGFFGDTGLTGRKIMVDTYGGLISHGGGCFSGKDPTKVDRSGAYMCRYVAKNVVAKGLAKKCFVSVAYAIGRAEPLMIDAKDEKGNNLTKFIKKNFDFRPRAIIERLNLQNPIYFGTAAYGHFGRSGFPWEKIEA